MKLYFAGSDTFFFGNNQNLFTDNLKLLETFWDKKDAIDLINKRKSLKSITSVFIDSGAYSAFTQESSINIDDYIKFLQEYKNNIDLYANLDSIGDDVKTLENQKHMESNGLNPLPCYHYGEDIKYLKYYVDNYEYFALGGMVGGSRNQLEYWLDNLWWKYLVDQKTGKAIIKIHGFGLTSEKLLMKYPWYSADSVSWVLTGRYGSVFCDLGTFTKIKLSNKGDIKGLTHYHQLPQHDQDQIREYFKNFKTGYTIEELSNVYQKRDQVNILYFKNLEKKLTDNPPIFILDQIGLF